MSFRPGIVARNAAHYRARAARARTDDARREFEGYAERLEDQLAAARRCKRCGQHLEDPESIKRGYGPDCWQEIRASEGSPTTQGATP